MEGQTTDQIEFVDNGTAPEFFASGLHDVEVMGPVSRFILFVVRRTPTGVLFREPAFTCIMPNDSIGPGIALTVQKTGVRFVLPIVGSAARNLVMH